MFVLSLLSKFKFRFNKTVCVINKTVDSYIIHPAYVPYTAAAVAAAAVSDAVAAAAVSAAAAAVAVLWGRYGCMHAGVHACIDACTVWVIAAAAARYLRRRQQQQHSLRGLLCYPLRGLLLQCRGVMNRGKFYLCLHAFCLFFTVFI